MSCTPTVYVFVYIMIGAHIKKINKKNNDWSPYRFLYLLSLLAKIKVYVLHI